MIPSPIALRKAASTFIAAAWPELAEYVVKSVKGMCELKDRHFKTGGSPHEGAF